jgi:hypothetical protein
MTTSRRKTVPSKRRLLFTRRHGVTFQKTWFFKSTHTQKKENKWTLYTNKVHTSSEFFHLYFVHLIFVYGKNKPTAQFAGMENIQILHSVKYMARWKRFHVNLKDLTDSFIFTSYTITSYTLTPHTIFRRMNHLNFLNYFFGNSVLNFNFRFMQGTSDYGIQVCDAV